MAPAAPAAPPPSAPGFSLLEAHPSASKLAGTIQVILSMRGNFRWIDPGQPY
jgi:hypothetical protein